MFDRFAMLETILFVTHCGMHGVFEALTYAVPMIGIPVFADQADVLVRLQERNLAVGLEKDSDVEAIHTAVMEVLTNRRLEYK